MDPDFRQDDVGWGRCLGPWVLTFVRQRGDFGVSLPAMLMV